MLTLAAASTLTHELGSGSKRTAPIGRTDESSPTESDHHAGHDGENIEDVLSLVGADVADEECTSTSRKRPVSEEERRKIVAAADSAIATTGRYSERAIARKFRRSRDTSIASSMRLGKSSRPRRRPPPPNRPSLRDVRHNRGGLLAVHRSSLRAYVPNFSDAPLRGLSRPKTGALRHSGTPALLLTFDFSRQTGQKIVGGGDRDHEQADDRLHEALCVQCNATHRALDSKGISYEVIDLSTDDQALATVKELGYLQAPIVITDGDRWSGFPPDKIAELTAGE